MDEPTIPPCPATGPDGARLVIHPHTERDSVADLARALDLPATTPLAIDDRPAAPYERLAAAGLRVGSRVTVPPAPHVPPFPMQPRASAPSTILWVAVAVGPACERWVALQPGRHTVGRSVSATIRVDDPTVELHHGVLDVDGDGSVTFTQLTGAFPVTVDGTPCRPAHPIGADSRLSLGTSRLVIGREIAAAPSVGAGSIVAADRNPWRSVVRRGPLSPDEAPTDPLEVPDPPPAHRPPPLTSLVGAGVAAAGAGVLAAVLGQMLFAVFAAVGAAASVATWGVGACVARRARRRARADHARALTEFEQDLLEAHAAAERDHRSRHHSVVDALEVAHGDQSTVWSRRCASGDALWATIGRGTCRWVPPIAPDARRHLNADLLVTLDRCERLEDVAVALPLEASSVVAVHGAPGATAAVCRSVIVQLATTYGPADWELQVVTDDPQRWRWVDWLPHCAHRAGVIDAADPAALVAAMEATGGRDDAGHERRSVIVVDAPALLSARTGALRRRLERGDVTCLALIEAETSVPAIVDRILEVGDTGVARWIETDGSSWTSADHEIVISGVSERTAEAAARRLAPLVDPEDHDDAAAGPAGVSLAELEPVGDDSAVVIARRWMQAGRDPAPVAWLGRSADGNVGVDLVRDGPHGLVAGTTGSGKSELLRTLVVSLAARVSPDHVTMILVDYKGGSTFDACARLPHIVGVVTDLDGGLAERMLVSLDAEVRRRERLLRAARAEDLSAYRRAVAEPLPRLVVVIDEFASLAKELPDFLGALVAIAQRGRSLGIHLLLATQRPAGVVTDDIRANTNLRIALRLHDRADAGDVVGDPAPSRFATGTPGRAALRLGPDDLVVFQTAASSGPLPVRAGRLRVEYPGTDVDPNTSTERAPEVRARDGPTVLEHLVEAIGRATTMVGATPPRRPWIDALPGLIRPCDLDDDPAAVGVLDDPAEQCRRPLAWQPSDGTLLLVGAVGVGTTTAAVSIAARRARMSGPDALHLYVVDAQGDAAWTAFEALEHCGAVIRLGEIERLVRLLARLTSELDRRSNEARREPTIVVVIDGFAAVRDTLGEVALGDAAMRLARVLRDGPALGVVAIITTDGSSSSALAVARSVTWVFHVIDPATARTAGLRAAPVDPGVPGRLRVVSSGLEGQIVLDPDPLGPMPTPAPTCDVDGSRRVGPAPIEVLAEVIDPDELDRRDATAARPAPAGDHPTELLIGLGADDLAPAVLRVPVGDHVFIGGAARTGRSTALRQVEAAWRRVHPEGVVVRVDRHHPPADVFGERAVLIVVDDAERVDDPDGRLVRIAGNVGVTFAVAARIEAVRVAYGHWTREIARSRCGLIMTSMGDIDGELLGATLPRRPSIPPRPGLAWVIDQDGHRLVQVAARMPP